jgi:hypothetical protein
MVALHQISSVANKRFELFKESKQNHTESADTNDRCSRISPKIRALVCITHTQSKALHKLPTTSKYPLCGL